MVHTDEDSPGTSQTAPAQRPNCSSSAEAPGEVIATP